MGLNIKNPGTEKAIRELAALKGQSLTGVVDTLVRDELERVQRAKSREGLAERAMEIGRQCVAETGGPWWEEGEDPAAFLYDEDGLPK